jgi:hypothetical protein
MEASIIVADVQPDAVPANVGYTPDQLRTAYGINGITFMGGTMTGDGSGQTIAIVDAYNDPNIVGDLDGFDHNVYLSASAKAAGTTLYTQYGAASSFLTAFDQNGNVINPANETSVPNAPLSTVWGSEISLDVEWAHAIAPGARIDLVECKFSTTSNLYMGAATAGGLSGVSAVSMSFGGPEISGEKSFDSDFVHPGVTFLAASGDNGSLFVEYPATSPNVVAVGGTTLNLNGNNTWASETGWTGSGGGPSAFETEPSYQVGVQNTGSRTTPDVSMDAAPNTGVAIYDSYNYGSSTPWAKVGGTSLATPCWAGLIAIANQGRIANGLSVLNASSPTQTQTFLYNLSSSDFHDITSGSNGIYSAGPGYDEVTGLGSPIAGTLVPDLAIAGLVSISPATLPQGQVGLGYNQTITASGGVGTDTLTITGLPAGLGYSASPNQLVISGTPSAAGTYVVTVTASDTAAHSTIMTYSLRITQTITGPLVVTNTSNLASVTGSLPWAVAQVDNDGTGQPMVIDFAAGVGQTFATPQTITLANTLVLVNPTPGDTITINGSAAGVTLAGGGSSSNFSVVTVAGGTTATINGLTVANGHVGGTGTGGGIASYGRLILTNDTIAGNSGHIGGGVFSDGSFTAMGDTFNSNSATSSGGGIFFSGTAAITDSTLTANSAQIGGGIIADSPGTVTNDTITANSASYAGGGGLWSYFYASVIALNTIVAGNLAGGSTYSKDLGGGGIAAASSHNLIGSNAMVAALGSYGGPTQTMPLLPGSPAINAGTGGAGVPSTDQRAFGRVNAVDIGAFESQGFVLTPVNGSTPQTAAIGTPFANPLAVTVIPNNSMEPVNGGIVSYANSTTSSALAVLSAPSAIIAGGQAAVVAEPNNAVGSYQVGASATGSSPASFALTNTGPVLTSLVVNTLSGSLFPGTGLLSLPEAVAFANFDSSGISTITFEPQVFAKPQTITLMGSQLELINTSETETITGPNAGVTVSGGGLSRVFEVDANVTASISGLTIIHGNAGTAGIPFIRGDGGGVDNLGTLSLVNCTISGNSSSSYGVGGGVNNYLGSLTMSNCTVSGNSAYAGCGLYNNSYPGTATLTNCTVSGNSSTGRDTSGGSLASGGGVFNINSLLTMTNCTISGNKAVFGGGLYNILFGMASLTNCTVSGNIADSGGGGIFNFNTFFGAYGATLTNCTVSGNSTVHPGAFGGGAGVYNSEGSPLTMISCTVSGNKDNSNGGGGIRNVVISTATLTDCTISGNSTSASGGGVLSNGYFSVAGYPNMATLTNCTVSGNTAGKSGGGLANGSFSSAALTNCTVSANSAVQGGGLSNQDALSVGNTIVAQNAASTSGPDALGAVASAGNNLVGATDGSTGWVGSDLTGTVALPVNPLLASLGWYGGSTQTMALLYGSPAIDAGSNALAVDADGNALTADQRGAGFPRVLGSQVDIGAFESPFNSQKITYGATFVGNTLVLFGGNTSDLVNIQHLGANTTGSTGIQVQGQMGGVNLNNLTYNPAPALIYIVGQGGSDTIGMENSLTIPTLVSEGNGNDNIQLGSGNNVVRAGTGNDSILAGDGSNTVMAGAAGSTGNIQVQLGNGANNSVMLLGNGNDQVQVGNGNYDSVSINGDGNDQVLVGDGNNDSVSINGNGNDHIEVGNGTNDFVWLVGNGNDGVQTGAGTGKAHVAGTGHKNLQLGKGWSLI